MVRTIFNTLLIAILFAMGMGESAFAKREIRVVASIPDLASIAKELLGDLADVRSLSGPNQDPHWVDARPSLALEVSRADYLLVNGLDLEVGWLPVLMQNSRNPRIQIGKSGFIDASRWVQIIQNGPVDRSMGDVHPGGNPHYTRALVEMENIAQGLAIYWSRQHPQHAKQIEENLKTWLTLNSAQQQSFKQQPIGGKKLIVYHDAWQYLARDAGLIQLGTVEPVPGIPPTAKSLFALSTMAKGQAACIVQASYFPAKAGRLLADQLEVPHLLVPGGTAYDKGETWLQYIERLYNRIAHECR